jgi:hypothetical protein
MFDLGHIDFLNPNVNSVLLDTPWFFFSNLKIQSSYR